MLEVNNEDLTVIRIEHEQLRHGMWYDHTGKLSPQPCVADVPMPYDNRRPPSERSAVVDVDALQSWFTEGVILNLLDSGFGVYEYAVKKFVVKPNAEVVFSLNDVLDRRPITLEFNNDLSE